MKNNKNKILVLSDLKKTASASLVNSVCLANMIDADIALFHVKKYIDIVDRDNQLSAIRTLNEEQNNTKNAIEALVYPISKDYNVKINYKYAFGNVKDEIRDYIKDFKPDIVVLGQRDSNPLQLIGDSITRFILKEFKGIIMISSNENALVPNKKMTLGVLNSSNKIFDTKFSKDIMTHTKTPLKSFKIINSQKESVSNSLTYEEDMVEYVFEQNDNTMTTLSSYLKKNNIDLLYVERTKDKSENNKNEIETSFKEVLSKLNVSLLVSQA